MAFLAPTMLALAALALPIIILYMLRLRRREMMVSSTLLWQRLTRDREANTLWQRLRRNLLLLLQLLILAALVMALARPYLPVPSVATGSVALILDASASMSAADMPGGSTRFAAAQDIARTLIADLASGEVMTVIAAGPTPLVLSPPTTDRAALREAVDRAQPIHAPADWEATLALAAASIAGRERASIVILSDGGLPADLPALPAEVRYVRLGREGHNLAVSALALRPTADSLQAFAAVSNYGPQDAAAILSISADGALLRAERLNVPAGETTHITLTDLPPDVSVIRAALTSPLEDASPDYLPLDDVAYAVYDPPLGGRILLVTEGNLFLEQVLAALPAVQAFRAAPGDLPTEPYDLVILDGWLPDELPHTNLLIVNPPHSSALFAVGEPFNETRFLRQADDPILSFVDFSQVAIREAVQVETSGWARPLVEAEGGPLLLAGEVDVRRVAILTFDLHASDLPLRVDFPILIANLLDWYAPAQLVDAPDVLRPADPVTIRPQATTTEVRITLPDGTRKLLPVGEGVLTFAATDQLGVYTVELLSGSAVTASDAFAVNLFAPTESAIAPRETITIGQAAVGEARTAEEVGQRELWPYLAAAALAVLLVEWWVYHRGSTLALTPAPSKRGILPPAYPLLRRKERRPGR